MKKIWKHLFNQNMLYILLMLVQIAFLVLSVLFLNRNYAWVYGALLLLNGLLIIYITNSRKNPTYKNAWLVVIAVLPIFGGLSYLFLKTRRDTRIFFHNYKQQMEQTKPLLTQEPDAARHLFNDSQQVYNLSTYLQHTGFPVYEHTNVTYFPLGEEQFAEMKNRLREAKRFIFIEYFIIAPGKMWNEFLEILIERARAGVEVRLMYDGFGTKFFSTGDFLKIAKQHHIQCRCFNPFRPLLSSAQNNRDHRKILVIDGNIAFNGGTNLADEYINEKVRFGHWKDTAIMLEGAAVWSYTMMFLQLWNMNNPNKKEAYDQYRPTYLPKQTNGGFIQPYGDSPVQDDVKGVMVYLDLISNAKRYVYIETPYLIPDHDLLTALKLAAEKGMRLTCHHHMGTGVQTVEEIDRFMAETDPRYVGLLLDSGHLTFAGVDPVPVLEKYIDRVWHVHLKDVRLPIRDQARREGWSFLTAVRNGVFTVPGDGDVDFAPIFDTLAKHDYAGWVVVEAEQDPAKANPFEYAVKARKYIAEKTGL